MGDSFFQTIRRRRAPFVLACLVFGGSITWGGAVTAQAARDAAAADPGVKARFANAQKLYKDGKFADALPIFRELTDSTHSPNARLYVGLCLQALGKHVDAHKAFSAVVKEVNEHPDEKYQQTREAAIEQLAVLNVRVGRVIIAVADAPPALAVTLDGVAVQESALGSAIVVDPGAHKIEASGSGVTAQKREVKVEGGDVKTVTLSFKKNVEETPFNVAGAPAASEPAPTTVEVKPSDGATMRTMSFVAGGVGVAGLGVFTVAGLMARSTFKDLETQCPGRCADNSYVDKIDRGKTLQTAANVGLVVGVVGVATGVTLFIVGRPRRDPAVAVSLSGGGATVSYTAGF
jgi:hypothetical protein